jgi:hypothetical protein
VLFIDSSHVVQVGGDVTHLFFQVLPRLAPGVVVHLHDIFLPREYPRAWVMEQHRFWTEQYLLQAFLRFNREFEILLSAGWLSAHHPEALAAAIPSWDAERSRPGSFWMRRVSADWSTASRCAVRRKLSSSASTRNDCVSSSPTEMSIAVAVRY